jgi:hypothetical protein
MGQRPTGAGAPARSIRQIGQRPAGATPRVAQTAAGIRQVTPGAPALQGQPPSQAQVAQTQAQVQATQAQTQVQTAQNQMQAAQGQVQAGAVTTAMAGPIGSPTPIAATGPTVASNAMDIQPGCAAPISYFYTTNNYIMDEKSDLSIFNPSKGTLGTTSTPVVPYESKINI